MRIPGSKNSKLRRALGRTMRIRSRPLLTLVAASWRLGQEFLRRTAVVMHDCHMEIASPQ
jgi:hypothetical protein